MTFFSFFFSLRLFFFSASMSRSTLSLSTNWTALSILSGLVSFKIDLWCLLHLCMAGSALFANAAFSDHSYINQAVSSTNATRRHCCGLKDVILLRVRLERWLLYELVNMSCSLREDPVDLPSTTPS